MGTQKSVWKSPELIVLARSRPEERVLATCKGGGGITSRDNRYNGCQTRTCRATEICSLISAS